MSRTTLTIQLNDTAAVNAFIDQNPDLLPAIKKNVACEVAKRLADILAKELMAELKEIARKEAAVTLNAHGMEHVLSWQGVFVHDKAKQAIRAVVKEQADNFFQTAVTETSREFIEGLGQRYLLDWINNKVKVGLAPLFETLVPQAAHELIEQRAK